MHFKTDFFFLALAKYNKLEVYVILQMVFLRMKGYQVDDKELIQNLCNINFAFPPALHVIMQASCGASGLQIQPPTSRVPMATNGEWKWQVYHMQPELRVLSSLANINGTSSCIIKHACIH